MLELKTAGYAFNSIEWILDKAAGVLKVVVNPAFNSIEWIQTLSYILGRLAEEGFTFNSIEWIPPHPSVRVKTQAGGYFQFH